MLILMQKFPYSLHAWATSKCHMHFRNEMEVAKKPALVRFCVSCWTYLQLWTNEQFYNHIIFLNKVVFWLLGSVLV